MSFIINLPKKKKKYHAIKSPSIKLVYLFRAFIESSLYKENIQKLGGLIEMLDGLDYHYKKHTSYEKKVIKGKSYGYASHEVTAYINRLGQIYYFFISKWLHDAICALKCREIKKPFNNKCVFNLALSQRIPMTLAIMPMRNKLVSHRQQDKPWGDDCTSLGFSEFGLKPWLVGLSKKNSVDYMRNLSAEGKEFNAPEDIKNIMDGYSIQYSFPTKQRDKLLAGIPSVKDLEFLGTNNNVIQFSPTKHHKKILEEIFNMLEFCFQFNNI